MSLSLQDLRIQPTERLLVYGIGNVGRQDDGIGVRLVERFERDEREGELAGGDRLMAVWPTFESNYQLGIEDALLLSTFDVILFLDASCDAASAAPFALRLVVASDAIAFTTHAMSFSSVLSICEELYGRAPRTFLMAIRGYEWGIGEELSALARLNFADAYASLSVVLESGRCSRRSEWEARAFGSRSADA